MTLSRSSAPPRRSPTALCLFAVLLEGLLGAAPPKASGERAEPPPGVRAADPAGGPVRFAWPRSGAVAVRGATVEDGVTVEFTYAVELAGQPDGTLQLQDRDFAVAAVDGEPMRPEMEVMLGALLASARHTPALFVDSDGQFAATGPLEPMIEAMAEAMGDAQGIPPEERAAIRAQLDGPFFRLVVTSAIEQQWNAWVGTWIGLELAPGEVAEDVLDLTAADGSTVPTRLRVTRHDDGPAADPSRVHLSMESSPADPAAATAAVVAAMRKVGVPVTDAEAAEARVEVVTVIDVVLDPATARPFRCSQVQRTRLVHPRHGDRSQVKEKRWTFDW